MAKSLAWGAKVSKTFRDRVFWIETQLGMPADYLMAAMAFESGESFRPDVRNAAGSGATGLIQFMPATARSLGTTVERLAAMTAEDQLNYVYKYFKPYNGRLKTLADVYMAILWPRAVGKPESYVLWTRDKEPTTYRQNAGLDADKNGAITKAEAAGKVQASWSRACSPARYGAADGGRLHGTGQDHRLVGRCSYGRRHRG